MLDKLTKAFSLLRQDFNALKGDVQRLEKVRPIVKHGKDGDQFYVSVEGSTNDDIDAETTSLKVTE